MPTAPRPGLQIGPYQLEVPLGKGGMGQVFRAFDSRLRRSVAIRFLLDQRDADPLVRRRFLQEARAASALNHPNIVAIYDIASQDGVDFLVMEFVPGRMLQQLIPAEGMALDALLQLAVEIAAALDAAHSAGIIHRDIKPANIMVTPGGQAKVLDFGVAKITAPVEFGPGGATQSISGVTTPGEVVGTLSYMSPEQIRGEPVDGRSDLFSFGCLLYQAATGRLPFRGANAMAVMYEIATVTPPSPASLRADLPANFSQFLLSCLEKFPCRRPASAADVARQLKALITEGSQPSPRLEPDRPAVAVIPFSLQTAAPEDEFLSVALADTVIHRLLATGKLNVRPTSSVARYKAARTEWPQIARELNVHLIVDGSIQKVGRKIRVLVQIHRASDGQTLLSSKHDGDAEDLFGLQDRIADAVSEHFAPRAKTSSLPARPPTKNPLAYELFLRAVDRLANWNRFDIGSGIEMLNQVVLIDPQFADAWGQLSQAYSQMGMFLDPDPKWFHLAETAIANALELDPVQGDALCARGFVLWSPSRGYQHRPALRAMNAALRLNPQRYNFRWFRGLILFHLGFYRDAERDANESLLANPKYSVVLVALGKIAEYRGNYEAASEYIDRALRLDPALILANIFAPINPLALGRLGEARDKLRDARAMVPGESRLTAIEGLIAAREGDFAHAERLAAKAVQDGRSVTHTHHTWHTVAGIYALCGKPELAITELRRCAAEGLPNYRLFSTDPFLQPLKDHPEFRALLTDLRRGQDQFSKEFDLDDSG